MHEKEASELEISADFDRLAKKQKKQFAREVTDAVIAEYSSYIQELDVSIESLIGIAEQQVDSRIISLQDMAGFVDNFHHKSGVIDFAKYRKPWPEIHSKELQFIDKLLDDRILNSLLSYEGYSPQMRDIFPCQLFRAELMKALKYPEISYRKYCKEEYMSLLIYCLLPRYLRYTKKIILLVSARLRDINYMPVVIFFVCLGVCAYLISNQNPSKSTDSSMRNPNDSFGANRRWARI